MPPDSCVRVGTIQFVVADQPGELWLDLVVEHGDEVATNRYVSTITRTWRLTTPAHQAGRSRQTLGGCVLDGESERSERTMEVELRCG